MRRIYTAFAARLVSHPLMLNAALFGVALAVFAQQVFVARVVDSLLNTQLGALPQFIFKALMRGEALTLMAIGVMVFTALSISWQLRIPHLFVARQTI